MNGKSENKIVIVGASGAVGREVLKILEQRNFHVSSLRALSSEKSAGKTFFFQNKEHKFELLKEGESFFGANFVFFTAGSEVSKKYVPSAIDSGAVVIDNSSFFRLKPDVPLIIPEVNGDVLKTALSRRGFGKGILVSNPNCTTAQMVMALKPLHDAFSIKRVVVSSYQAVSGRGKSGVDEFINQVKLATQNGFTHFSGSSEQFPHPIAFNCLPHIDVFHSDGFTGEEYKVIHETRKILSEPELGVLPTCVRVPVLNCHSESVSIETRKAISVNLARDVLKKMPGVKLFDDVKNNSYPIATLASGTDDVWVGRIREDSSLGEGRYGLAFWVVADNLRKGAALNAVQIAEFTLK